MRLGVEHGLGIVMQECPRSGRETESILPNGLNVKRRGAGPVAKFSRHRHGPLSSTHWLNALPIVMNEETAAGGRIATAPTNGAAGIIPAVAHYYLRFPDGNETGLGRYLLAAAGIVLNQENGSIFRRRGRLPRRSEVACSMAAAGLAAALEGDNRQVENAAEIGMVHMDAAGMPMENNGGQKVTYDQVIQTMCQTGMDMQTRDRETSLGGLA